MKRIVFYFMVLVIAISTGCNRANQNNSQQAPVQDQGMPGGGFGQGRGQGNFDPAAMADRQIEQMKETLNLSEEQEKQLREIMIQNSEEMQQMRGNTQGAGTGDREAMREQMQQMRDKQNEKMKSVLTDEQWETYQAQQEEMRSRRGQGGFGGGQRPN